MPGKIKPQKIRIKRPVKGSVPNRRPLSGAEYDRMRTVHLGSLGPSFADKRVATGGKVYDPKRVDIFNMSGYIGKYKDVYNLKSKIREARTGRKKV